MHFKIKNTLKNNRNYTLEHAHNLIKKRKEVRVPYDMHASSEKQKHFIDKRKERDTL